MEELFEEYGASIIETLLCLVMIGAIYGILQVVWELPL